MVQASRLPFPCQLAHALPASLCLTDYLIHWRSVWILFPLGCICYSSIHVSLNAAKCYCYSSSQRIPFGSKALIDPPCMLEGVAIILNTGVFFQLIYQMKLHTHLFLICDIDSTFNLTVSFSIETVLLKKLLKN